MTVTDPAEAPLLRSFDLDYPIVAGGEVKHPAGTTITVRKPGAGEMRGLKVMDLMQMDYAAIEAIAPRITNPILHKQLVAAMDPADFTQLGGEIMDFLLPKSAKDAAFPEA